MKHTFARHSELITAGIRGPAVLFIAVLSMVLTAQAATFTHHGFIVRACMSNGSHAEALTVSIGFGESLAGRIDGIGATTRWKIRNAMSGEVLATGSGRALLDVVFERPGAYRVDIEDGTGSHDTRVCEHSSLPGRINVLVGAARMKFDLEDVALTRAIVGGVSTDDINLRVPVEVTVYDGGTLEFNVPEVRSAGVGTTIVGRPSTPVLILTNGRMMIEYTLSGLAESGTYIMFDLTDVNGQVVTYPCMQVIR